MTQNRDYELVCMECGRPIEEDDDGICSACVDEGLRSKHSRRHFGRGDDGKRLPKSKRPRGHRPTSSKRSIESTPKRAEGDHSSERERDDKRRDLEQASKRRRL